MRPAEKILIVEDENIVARDIRSTLNRIGYECVLTASTGEEAVRLARCENPDLVLMDIALAKGFIDGVDTVVKLRDIIDVPVIYLTAHSDDATLQRARFTRPDGYILKPFQLRELQVTIEMSLYRHRVEKHAREQAKWFETVLSSIGDGVIATDEVARIRFYNPVARILLGWDKSTMEGRAIDETIQIKSNDGNLMPNPVRTAAALRTAVVFNGAVLSTTQKSVPVACTAAPIHDDRGRARGCVFTFRDITELDRARQELAKRMEDVEHAKRVLERYFPENLVDFLVDQKRGTDLNGKNVEASIMFCDVRNSTGIAEQLGPSSFARLISELFSGIMDLTYANSGSVNKILGDGLLITFGCPFPEPEDPLNCVRLALQIREYVRAFNEHPPVPINQAIGLGIGISTGTVFAGNIGSARHMDYTVLGDAVNTASRLEALTKVSGSDILMDANTRLRVQNDIEARFAGNYELRGKTNGVDVFHPTGMI